jgi:ABC-type glycerol-3-phosphate transport system substrate-binding protein
MKKGRQLLVLVIILSLLGGSGVALARQEKVSISLWIFEGEEEFLYNSESAFEAANPTIDLVITLIPEEEYVTKIETALAAGKPPDIAFVYSPNWLKIGAFVPLDDLVTEIGLDVSALNQSALSGCYFEGNLYCLGSDSALEFLLYNKDFLDAAGVPYPSATKPLTVDEYADLAAKLSKPSDDLSQRVWGGAAGAPYWWIDFRTMFSEDGRETIGYLDDVATTHMYQVLAQMVIDGNAPGVSDYDFFGETDLFLTGHIAMSIADNYSLGDLEAAGIHWGAAPVPVEDASSEAWVPAWTDNMGVFAASDHQAEALEFIKFLVTDGQRLRVENGQLPLDIQLATDLNWAGDSEGRQEVLGVMGLARPNIFVPDFWGFGPGILEDYFNSIVDGDMTADEAMKEAASEMQDSLDLAWTTWEQLD